MSSNVHDVAILGGGITGTAIAFVLSRYTNVRSILMFERHRTVAQVNTGVSSNSQTQHRGACETNYPLKKALRVKAGADLQIGYVRRFAPEVYEPMHQMVIGVGEAEAGALALRYDEFRRHYPGLQFLDRDGIAEIEPNVVLGRDPREKLVALCEPDGLAVNYEMLAASYLRNARQGRAKVQTVFGAQIDTIERRDNGLFVLKGESGESAARAVIVAAGSPSLLFAHAMGYGREFMILPAAGNFYRGRGLLNGKVYTVQHPSIPLAAVHGDPAVYDRSETRFGPTAMLLPFLERGRWSTVWEFLRTGIATPKGMRAALGVFWDKDIAAFALKNIGYALPFAGRRLFARTARKIVPTLRTRDLKLDRGAGGIRGQLVDLNTRQTAKGHDKIVGDGIIFNMAPSPGASFGLGNAVEDARMIARFLGDDASFDEVRLRCDLGLDPALFQGAA